MEIIENIITNICEMNEVAATEERGVSHFSKTLKGAGSIVPLRLHSNPQQIPILAVVILIPRCLILVLV
jgi:hypothetical protein